MQRLIPALACLLLLTSCVSREQADERLARGCKAGAELFLDEGFKITKIKRVTHKDSLEFGAGYREVMLFASESDDWIDKETEYKCTFAEDYGPMKSTHRATLYQLNVNGQTYGIKNGQVLGDMGTHINLTTTIDKAMSP